MSVAHPAVRPPARPSVRQVLRELSAAQKTPAGVSLYTRWVNRPAGRALAAVAVRAGLSANAVTAVSALTTAGGVVLLAVVPPSVGTGLAVALVLAAGFALDSADGQVSRYTGTGSPAGEWFDHVADAGKMVAVHGAVLIGWYRFVDQPSAAWLLAPLAFQLVAVLMFAGGTLDDLLRRSGPRERDATGARRPSLVRSVALLPVDYGVLTWTFVLWGVPAVHRWVYLVLLVVDAALLLALLRRWFTGLLVPAAR